MIRLALVPWALGAAWGLACAAPLARRAATTTVTARTTALARRTGRVPARRRRRVAAWWEAHADRPGLRVVHRLRARRSSRGHDVLVARELPVAIDLLGVAVGAGCTPYLAVEVAARWSPRPLADSFGSVLRSCELGLDFEAALDATARVTPRLRPLADALLASDRLGVPVGPVLGRLAEEDRTALRRAAEAHARRIPVRLLFPLVFLVLPAFVLLTVVPGLAAGLGRL